MLHKANELITPDFTNSYLKTLNLPNNVFKLKDMRESHIRFAKFMTGFTLRDYQSLLSNTIMEEQMVGIVKGRQIGFTTTLASLCAWAVWFNKLPAGMENKTKICVVSKDEPAAKNLLQMIKDFFYMGDRHMSAFLKKKDKTFQYFSSNFKTDNVDKLVLRNGCEICSFPPTKKVRGTSNSLLIIDEAAFLNNNDPSKFFITDALPSISETNGKVVVSSTANGIGGFYYDLIDPENKKNNSMYTRISFPYTVNHANPNYMKNAELLKSQIEPKDFSQEYLCEFNQSDVNFFDSEKVQDIFNNNIHDLDYNCKEMVLSIDYGMTESRTCLALSFEHDGVIYHAYLKEFERGYDINGLIPFITGLKDRYNIIKMIPDDCPQGDAINKQMISLGWPIELFDFHTKKIQTYVAYRSRMNKGEVSLPYDSETELQFLEMQQEESNMGNLKIHKPRSGRDDRVDTLMMGASPFLNNEERLGVWLV